MPALSPRVNYLPDQRAIAGTDLFRGGLLSRVLSGSWRRDVVPALLSEDELDLVVPLVILSGTAGLAWRRIRATTLATSDVGSQLRQAHLVLAAEAAIRESHLERLLSVGGVADVDQILVKGWAHARLYPVPGLRPHGDVDLRTRPDRLEQLERGFASLPPVHPHIAVPADLQTASVELPDRSWDDILGHSCLVALRSTRVRVLGPEDAFRLCCLHLLRHAIEMPPRSNPLWLCDVSVMLENLSADFDWDYCASGQPWRRQWMFAVIRLANQLLGARVDRCPSERLPSSVPDWMVKTFLRIWGHRESDPQLWPQPRPLGQFRRDIRELPSLIAERWPNPLQSVFRLSWPINRVSGRVAQVLDYAIRALTWGPRQLSIYPSNGPVG